MVGGKTDGQILLGAKSEKTKNLFDAWSEKRNNVFGAKWQLRENVFGSQSVNLYSATYIIQTLSSGA